MVFTTLLVPVPVLASMFSLLSRECVPDVTHARLEA